jgi:tRNA A-37 threonylcarbamoyl transferase component Bud32
MEKLGHYVAVMHGARFYYHDLKLRNILWQEDSIDDEGLYFIDCPRGRNKPWHSYRSAMYDLNTLFKDARKVCSPPELKGFLEEYVGCSNLSMTRLISDLDIGNLF